MDIDIKELEAFSGVVEKGSFSRAAHALYLTQPTVSAHIASLERKLGVKLLVRTTKEIYPSEAGRLLYEYAREILRLRSAAVQAISAFSGELRGTVSVAATATAGQYHLPALIRSFRSSHPDIQFDLQILSSGEVAERIASRKAEIGFTTVQHNLPKCLYQKLEDDPLVLATPNTPTYRACRPTAFPLRDLAKETFLSREEGSRSRSDLEHFLKECGIDPREIMVAAQVRSNESIRQMVSEGLGVALLPDSVCADYRQFGKILTFSFDSQILRRSLYLLRHKNSALSPIAQAFFDHAAQGAAQETSSALTE